MNDTDNQMSLATMDFADLYESNPRAAVDAIIALLLDEQAVQQRVAFLNQVKQLALRAGNELPEELSCTPEFLATIRQHGVMPAIEQNLVQFADLDNYCTDSNSLVQVQRAFVGESEDLSEEEANLLLEGDHGDPFADATEPIVRAYATAANTIPPSPDQRWAWRSVDGKYSADLEATGSPVESIVMTFYGEDESRLKDLPWNSITLSGQSPMEVLANGSIRFDPSVLTGDLRMSTDKLAWERQS